MLNRQSAALRAVSLLHRSCYQRTTAMIRPLPPVGTLAQQRPLSVSSMRSAPTNDSFEEAQRSVKQLRQEPDVDIKLKLYALYKQATSGDVAGSRPGMMDFAERAKYDAWKQLEGMAGEKAQSDYVALVVSLTAKEGATAGGGEEAMVKEGSGIRAVKEGKIYRIEWNRPDKFNAITWEMYESMITSLAAASTDPDTAITVLTGNGPYYCSGNDLSNFTRALKSREELLQVADQAEDVLERFVAAHITHEKPLIALVNGPAIGVSVTVLALCDLVVASSRATFQTPFTALGQSPEGCSSLTFPTLMGASKASEMLLFGKKLTAEEAVDRNLAGKVVPYDRWGEETSRLVSELSQLPPESLRLNKQLVRSAIKEELLRVNKEECRLLKSRWLSAECHQALAKFMTRKSNGGGGGAASKM